MAGLREKKKGKSMGSDPVKQFDERMRARSTKAKAIGREEYTTPYGRKMSRPDWSDQPGGKAINKLAKKAPLWDYGSKSRQADLDRDRKYWADKERNKVRQSPLQPVTVKFGGKKRT